MESLNKPLFSDLASCINECPCFDQCPNGCIECSSKYCACSDKENYPDFTLCNELAELDFRNCILKCSHDSACFQKCEADYSESLYECPCNKGCLSGCPCDNFECVYDKTTTTTTRKLSLNSKINFVKIVEHFTRSTRRETHRAH